MEVTIKDLSEILLKTSTGSKISQLDEDDSLKEQGVDSLDLLDFYFNLEEHYNIQIPDEDVSELRSLKDIQNYLSKRLNEV